MKPASGFTTSEDDMRKCDAMKSALRRATEARYMREWLQDVRQRRVYFGGETRSYHRIGVSEYVKTTQVILEMQDR